MVKIRYFELYKDGTIHLLNSHRYSFSPPSSFQKKPTQVYEIWEFFLRSE